MTTNKKRCLIKNSDRLISSALSFHNDPPLRHNKKPTTSWRDWQQTFGCKIFVFFFIYFYLNRKIIVTNKYHKWLSFILFVLAVWGGRIARIAEIFFLFFEDISQVLLSARNYKNGFRFCCCCLCMNAAWINVLVSYIRKISIN